MSEIGTGEFSELVSRIYDAAIDPSRWPDALEGIVVSVGCAFGGISVNDPARRKTRFLYDWGADQDYLKLYREMYQSLNPSLTSSWYMETGQPFTSSAFLGDEEFYASRFYREWCAPQGVIDAICVILAKSATRFGAMTIVRRDDQGRFTDEVAHTLRLLAPHVCRAAAIADLLDAKKLQSEMLSSTLDLMTIGVLLVDGEGRVVHANRAALQQFDRRQCALRIGSKLACSDAVSTDAIRQAIGRAAHSDPSTLGTFGIAVPITGRGDQDLAAWILPLDASLRRELGAPAMATVAIFVRELGDSSPFPGELLVKRYGITPAECRVLILLAKGMTPREAAVTLGISEATAKTHLQRLFQKTATQRQADLVRLVTTALAPASSLRDANQARG